MAAARCGLRSKPRSSMSAAPKRRMAASLSAVWLAVAILASSACVDLSSATRLASEVSSSGQGHLPSLSKKRRRKGWLFGLAAAAHLSRSGEALSVSPLRTSSGSVDIDQIRWSISNTNREVRKEGLEMLKSMGDIASFCDVLNDEDPHVRKAAIEAFGGFRGADWARGIATMQNLLEDSDEDVRGAAHGKLNRLKELTFPGGRKMLEKALSSNSTADRLRAMRALSLLQSPLEPQDVAALHSALRHDVYDVRAGASQALTDLGTYAWGEPSKIKKALKGKDVYMRRAAARALGLASLRYDVETMVLLKKAFLDKDLEVRLQAVQAASRVGKLSTDAVVSLRTVLKAEDVHARRAAIELFDNIQSDAVPQALAALQEALQDEDAEVQWSASIRLGEVGVEAWPGGLVGIRAAFDEGDVFSRRAASLALGKARPTTPDQELEFQEVFDQALRDKDSFVRWVISRARGIPAIEIWDGGREEIHQAIKLGDDFERRAAVDSLGSLGASFKKKDLDMLIRALKHPDFLTRGRAAAVLGRLGTSIGIRGRDALQRAMGDESGHVAHTAMISAFSLDRYRGT